jgi:hypothetical protein
MKLSRITQSISFGRFKKVVYSRSQRFESLCINIHIFDDGLALFIDAITIYRLPERN